MHTVPADLRARGAAAEAVVGALWWAVGSAVLPAGAGTLVLAAGLALTFGLVLVGRRYPVYREPLPPQARQVALTALLAGAALIAVSVVLAHQLGFGELAAPAGGVIVGGCYLWAAGRLHRRGELLLGLALLALGVCGMLLALRSAGELYPRGLVGLGSGALFWAAAALRIGLHHRLRAGARG